MRRRCGAGLVLFPDEDGACFQCGKQRNKTEVFIRSVVLHAQHGAHSMLRHNRGIIKQIICAGDFQGVKTAPEASPQLFPHQVPFGKQERDVCQIGWNDTVMPVLRSTESPPV